MLIRGLWRGWDKTPHAIGGPATAGTIASDVVNTALQVLLVAATPPLAEMPLPELLEQVPPVGCEWRYDRTTGKGLEHPVSAELARRLSAGAVLTDEQWRMALIESRAIVVRDKWPAGEPLAVSMTVPRWLGLAQIRAQPRLRSLKLAKAGELMWSFSGTWPAIRARAAKHQTIGHLPADITSLTFHVTVERGRNGLFDEDAPPPGVLWKGEMTFPVEVVATIDEAVPPARHAELDEAVAHAVCAGVWSWGDREVVYVAVDPDTDRFAALARTGLSLRIEVLKAGEPVEEAIVVAHRLDDLLAATSVSTAWFRLFGSCNLESVPAAVVTNADELQEWTLRVSGVSDHVLVLWDAEVRWGGMITIPLAEALTRERQRAGPTGRGPRVSTPWPK